MDKALRKKIEDLILQQIKESVPAEIYALIELFLPAFSDEELRGLCEGLLNMCDMDGTDMTPDDLYDALCACGEQLREPFSFTPIETMLQKEANPLWKRLDRSAPLGRVSLLRSEDQELYELWHKDDEDTPVPPEAVLSGDLSAGDIEISIDETGQEGGALFVFRVLIFPEAADLAKEHSGETVTAGVMRFGGVGTEGEDIELLMPVLLTGEGAVTTGPLGCRTAKLARGLRENGSMSKEQIDELGRAMLEAWYGVQYRLAHPADDYLYYSIYWSLFPDKEPAVLYQE